MTVLLRQALAEAVEAGQSVRSIARETGLKHPALLKFLRGEQSLRLDLADKLATYFGIECCKETKMEIDDVIERITHPSELWTWPALEHARNLPPKEPGAYGVWFREAAIPATVPKGETVLRNGLRLLYLGISPRNPDSGGDLRQRIREHYRGKAAGTTLRFSLGCLLDMSLHDVGRKRERLTFADEEAVLSAWMAENVSFAWVEYPGPWEIEEPILRRLDLPLNIYENTMHPFCPHLRRLRYEVRAAARSERQRGN